MHEQISWTYKATTDITLQIQNVKYINKVSRSVISLYSDNSIIGYYNTSTSDIDSNKLMSSGKIGQNRMIPRGHHAIRLQVIHTESNIFDLQINVVIAQFTKHVPETDHSSCPYVPPDNGGSKSSDSKTVALSVTSLIVGGIVTPCAIFLLGMYCKRKKERKAMQLITSDPESPIINVHVDKHRSTNQ